MPTWNANLNTKMSKSGKKKRRPPFFADVVQWLKGDTFEENSTTYMRDYSGNDYHAVVVDSNTIVQQVSSTELYTADLLNGGYWYSDASTPIQRSFSELEFDYNDEATALHVTFSDINTDNSFKNIVTYNSAQPVSRLNRIYTFIKDQVIRNEVGQPILDELGNIIRLAMEQ